MNLRESIKKLLSLIHKKHIDESINKKYAYMWGNFYVNYENKDVFDDTLNNIYLHDKDLCKKFSKKKIFNYITRHLIEYKKSGKDFTNDSIKNLFDDFKKKTPYNGIVVAPISGIILEEKFKVKFGCFEVGKAQLIKALQSEDYEYYISVEINEIYDEAIAIEKAKNMFVDFIRLIAFIDGNISKDVYIKLGLPVYKNFSKEQIHIGVDSYTILKNIDDEHLTAFNLSNNTAYKIPLDNDFFCNNPDFNKLWSIYISTKKSDIENRIVNAALNIGESLLSKDIKNSILNTCIAFETLFLFDEKGLFSPSIVDKISDTAVFLACKDVEHRITTKQKIKKLYGLRSMLVHGGNKEINYSYDELNGCLRAAIRVLLNNEKFKNLTKIKDLYDKVQYAQKSYKV